MDMAHHHTTSLSSQAEREGSGVSLSLIIPIWRIHPIGRSLLLRSLFFTDHESRKRMHPLRPASIDPLLLSLVQEKDPRRTLRTYRHADPVDLRIPGKDSENVLHAVCKKNLIASTAF